MFASYLVSCSTSSFSCIADGAKEALTEWHYSGTKVFIFFLLQFFSLKVARQVLGQKFYENTKKSSLYSQTLKAF